ncbi:hypothetical protein CQ14_35520 [Bradyrhizobium lablabi]|uniref:Transmembrane protein n=1 Tax=Bradyrhizobium lablabi TaxID=722472 RepID=A0A0R3MR09_9BRAD|nr:hypothetical protein [Bradyrhizobium lablabi]KRR22537.1 hypothetical protein CQ14_35520 [Bradyrhizobium lablabi]
MSIPSLLHKRARWFVALAWLLLVLSVLAYFIVGIGSAINARYHPQHEWVSYDRALVHLLQWVFWIAAAAAVGSSLALVLRRRVATSAFVVACWVGLVIGGTVYLNSVPRGPQHFDRYAGEMHFRIPWQFGPEGYSNGVDMFLCLDTLSGRYDEACRHGRQSQLSIYPAMDRFMGFVAETPWQRHPEKFAAAGVQSGHQAYVQSIPAEGRRPGLTLYYFLRSDPEGKTLRTVECFESGGCNHHTRLERYILYYTAPRTALPQWEEMDRKLKSLVDSWVVP